MTNSLKDLLTAEAAHAEATKDDPYPEGTVWTQPNKARSVVQSVRLPTEALAEAERIAAEHEVPVSALIRGWVLRALAEERQGTLSGALDQLAADVERVRRMAAGA